MTLAVSKALSLSGNQKIGWLSSSRRQPPSDSTTCNTVPATDPSPWIGKRPRPSFTAYSRPRPVPFAEWHPSLVQRRAAGGMNRLSGRVGPVCRRTARAGVGKVLQGADCNVVDITTEIKAMVAVGRCLVLLYIRLLSAGSARKADDKRARLLR